jgi:hypothetical protein
MSAKSLGKYQDKYYIKIKRETSLWDIVSVDESSFETEVIFHSLKANPLYLDH